MVVRSVLCFNGYHDAVARDVVLNLLNDLPIFPPD